MESIVARNSVVFFLTLVFLLSEPRFTDGQCDVRKNGTLARCNYIEDVNTIDTHQLKSLKVSTVDKYLSADYFSNLTSLRHLDLSNGKLKKVKTGSFHHLPNLRSLDLSNNFLAYLGPGVLTNLRHLHILNLSLNSFDEIPDDISNLKNLKSLDLSYNLLNCDCQTLKKKDRLISRGVVISSKTACTEPEDLKGNLLLEIDSQEVCKHDEFGSDEGMQMDQPLQDPEGSGEGSGDPFDEIQAEDIPEEDDKSESSTITSITTTSNPIEIPLTSESTSKTDDEIFFSEDSEKRVATPPMISSSLATTEASTKSIQSSTEEEGSGRDDADDPWLEGSGFDGSGAIPHITWNEHTDESENDTTSQPTGTTESEGFIDTLYSLIWGTPPPPPTSTTEDVDLEEEQFIKATTEAPKVKSPDAEMIDMVSVSKVEAGTKKEDEKARVIDSSKSGENLNVKVASEASETADASAAQETKKGMGSYVVLAVLLSVLAVLIGFAAYKGDFCRERRKRNNRNIEASDMENGTELKDLKKSLLENVNSVQPKIATNGKTEEAPLVTPVAQEAKDIEPSSRYVGTVNESAADPIKPPRKSFSPHEIENGNKSGTNGKISTIPQLSTIDNVRTPAGRDVLVNGKNDRDSLSSVGESPSSGSYSTRLSNSRLSQGLPPASPGAQRVKITLQDNPDSIPKTPLLITRTKAGENLVKTP